MVNTYESLVANGGIVVGYNDVIRDSDWQIMGNEKNRAICPPEKKWVGWKTIPFPHPTFLRLSNV